MNMSYLGGEWYIDQMRVKSNDSEPVPFSLPRKKYTYNNDFLVVRDLIKEPVPIQDAIEFIKSDAPQTKVTIGGKECDFLPAKQLILPVNKENVLKSGIVKPEDADLIEEATALMDEFEKTYEELRISTLLTGEYDKDDAILTLHAGAGGTESCDWAGMLYRMFTRWAGKKGYGTEVLDYLDGDEAGIKSVTVKITGMNAYGYLRSEKGVHRLVRSSPFNAAGKRQTSFASCDVMPDIKDDIEVEIADEDIRIDTYRASGAGGQHINKTDSAIRITHLPTGIVVQCQNERSQHKNKDQAMKMLKTKLYLLKQQQHLEKLSDIRGDVGDNGWGNQIRSYVLQPYTMVKDHRTNFESGNPSAVLDGDLDGFMNAYLAWDNNSKKEEN